MLTDLIGYGQTLFKKRVNTGLKNRDVDVEVSD